MKAAAEKTGTDSKEILPNVADESIAPELPAVALFNSPGVDDTGAPVSFAVTPVAVSTNSKREQNAARARKYRESKKAKEVLGEAKADETIAIAAESVKPKKAKSKEPTLEEIVNCKDLIVMALHPLRALEMDGETWSADIVNVACPALSGEPGKQWAEKVAPVLARYMPATLTGVEASAAIATLALVSHIGGKVMDRREARYEAAQSANRTPVQTEAAH